MLKEKNHELSKRLQEIQNYKKKLYSLNTALAKTEEQERKRITQVTEEIDSSLSALTDSFEAENETASVEN